MAGLQEQIVRPAELQEGQPPFRPEDSMKFLKGGLQITDIPKGKSHDRRVKTAGIERKLFRLSLHTADMPEGSRNLSKFLERGPQHRKGEVAGGHLP